MNNIYVFSDLKDIAGQKGVMRLLCLLYLTSSIAGCLEASLTSLHLNTLSFNSSRRQDQGWPTKFGLWSPAAMTNPELSYATLFFPGNSAVVVAATCSLASASSLPQL